MSINLKTDTKNFLHDNPALYSAFNGDYHQSMAKFMHKLLTEYNGGKKVLDIGSGLGREVAYLNSVEYEATGLDNSKEMFSWAKEHYPDSPFVFGDQVDFSLNEKEGQRWLSEDLLDQTVFEDMVVTLKTRFSIDLASQMLERSYSCSVTGYEPILEHVRHRLFFPQELVHYLSNSGFRLLQLFDQPSPHVKKYSLHTPLAFSTDMQGTRMQVVAQAI
ncbi:trans-aconitate 2-methyltransferase [Evansella sp. AB-rgal1]|uniref:class I SAM-dependent methyltransferase n=1 Tax=Evansella sp. AB-rgal1 TaxID=3242696 RepID=UPI00359CE4AE